MVIGNEICLIHICLNQVLIPVIRRSVVIYNLFYCRI
nr:MAG TPA: hypothetical protein [Microviridae sp.]